ncbi:resolvase domain-containing protein [Hippea maritima]|uniref:Resolvase domain protein n=1 Tax=Hippea maritima (strain ATCC 700847 / DSM 10411 / MH2) TaxID=760142 RepID=F2LU45_HIPMA|nr:resolvase domain-containing protein [Hippea maritima]AEA34508.1 resolvase domain protein [Hippea maritima DSM 10411]
MGKIYGYIQYDSEADRIVQKAAIDKFVKSKYGIASDGIEYLEENVKPYISWKNRQLGKELLPKLEEGDVLVVSESKRLGSSSPEIDVFLMYATDKGAEVYEAKLDTKISGY